MAPPVIHSGARLTAPGPRPRAIQRTPALAMPEIAVADAAAIKALARGDASPEQQKRALDWVVKKACAIGSVSFDAQSSELTAFNEGKRFVGVLLVNVLNDPIEKFKK